MTLQEYINQTKPSRFPKVLLQREEVEIYGGKQKFAQIPQISVKYGIDAVYMIEDSTLALWTIDEQGNKRVCSCFSLDFNPNN
jgi:hypothetical protein